MDSNVTRRVANLTDSITFQVFQYTTRYTLVLLEFSQICTLGVCSSVTSWSSRLRWLSRSCWWRTRSTHWNWISSSGESLGEILWAKAASRFPTAPNITSPVDFISNIGWGAIKVPDTWTFDCSCVWIHASIHLANACVLKTDKETLEVVIFLT